VIQTPNRTVAVTDELQFRMRDARAYFEERMEELLTRLRPSQVSSGFCHSLLMQLKSLHCQMLPDDHQRMRLTFTDNMFSQARLMRERCNEVFPVNIAVQAVLQPRPDPMLL
jgi:hypothetical protein